MPKKEQLLDICMDVYRELYANATPKANFDRMVQTGEASQVGFFKKYYMPQEEQDKIIEKHIKKNKLTDRFDGEKIRTRVNLGCSPNSCKEMWEKERR